MKTTCNICSLDNARYLTISDGKQIFLCADCARHIQPIPKLMDNPHFWND